MAPNPDFMLRVERYVTSQKTPVHKSVRRLSWVLILLLAALGCNLGQISPDITRPAGLTTTPIFTRTMPPPTVAVGTTSPSAIPTPGMSRYTNPNYGFAFQYPISWAIQETNHRVRLIQDSLAFDIWFRRSGETGEEWGAVRLPQGQWSQENRVDFLGREVQRQTLRVDGKVKAMRFEAETNRPISIGELEFALFLTDTAPDLAAADIPASTLEEADRIVASFERITGTATSLVKYTNSQYGFSFLYPSSWQIQEEPNRIRLELGELAVEIAIRRANETVAGWDDFQLPPGKLETHGSVKFLEQVLLRQVLVSDGREKAVFYNGIQEIPVGDLRFHLSLHDESQDYAAIDLSDDRQAEVDQFLTSFQVDFQVTPAPCSDKASFVEDVTVPDGATFGAGEKIVKIWRLRNDGTCPWTTEYELVFVDGDPMGAASPSRLTQEVKPGETADLAINLTAPNTPGSYQALWQLRTPQGRIFGIGKGGDQPFWVRINVVETTSSLNLGTPTFVETFDTSANWYLITTDNTRFDLKDGRLVMTTLQPGRIDEWGLANKPLVKNFYLEVTFKTGASCAGRDRYGILARAPDANSGYVFGFSCDGYYRMYNWDGQNYNPLQEWTSSEAILSGPDQTNRMGLWANGGDLKLYANGKLLVELNDMSYKEGRYGLFIGSGETENLIIYVEELSIWDLGG